ncbi:efflux RND transporter periplasmic adaptor subunit [Spongiivirga sp. MCCC 1A20706]|uniref:efflux RND transporter periplasmic adaptor subunit n=1 Tax=Spongiivirga sp. MCCC 1A20706 TaxID=3160963 RepID=UPI0039776E0A
MKILKYILIAVFVLGALFAAAFFIKSNSKSPITFKTESPFKTSIEQKTVATGKVVPEEEVEVKPQVTGIIEKIFVKEGKEVRSGDLIAKIKVVPNEQALNGARGRVRNAEINLRNAKIDFDRNKEIFDKGVISQQDFQNIQLRYDQAKQELTNARNDLQIIRQGSTGGAQAITNIRASVKGTILEIPVEEGDQVIQSNNFNAGTTVATIADMKKMIFEGKVDEAEVGKLEVGMPLKVSLGAIEDQEFEAKLKFIAPKGNEEQGAVQFRIEGDVYLDENFYVRAGYSANASLVLEKKEDVLAIKEALLQFDKETDKPYVEIQTGDQQFERRDIKTGLSDGVNIEILEGLSQDDKVKVWNQTEPKKKDSEEDDEAGEEVAD